MTKLVLPDYTGNEVIYPHLCYSVMLGIEDRDGFHNRNNVRDEYVLMYVTKGVLFCTQYGVNYTLGAGEYILLNKAFEHEYWFGKKIPSEIYWMHMSGEMTIQLVDMIENLSPLPITGKDQYIYESIKLGLTLNDPLKMEPFAHSANIINTLMHIMESVYNKKKENEYTPEEFAFRSRVEMIIRNADLSTFTLDKMCEEMHLNRYYFAHQFKNYYSVSPMKYVTSVKIERAKNLLRSSDMKIAVISRECGFSSPAYFSTAFRRETGMSPEAFRAQWNSLSEQSDW